MDAGIGTAVATAAATAATTIPETMTATAVAVAPVVPVPAFDMTNPTMVAMYVAGIVALVVKGLIDLLAKRLSLMGRVGPDGKAKVRKGAVILIQSIVGMLVYLVAYYALGWPVELAAIAAGGGYGAGVADLAHKAVLGRPPLVSSSGK